MNIRNNIIIYLILYATVFQVMSQSIKPSDEYAQEEDGKEKLIIATGVLLHTETQSIGTAPIWEDSSVGAATYRIDHITYGALSTNVIRVVYSANSVHTSIPKRAILLLSGFTDGRGTYSALGNEAWRSILPDTEANRVRIANSSPGELSKTPIEDELSKEMAKELAVQALVNHGDYTAYVKFNPIKRKDFGWIIVANVIEPDSEDEYIKQFDIVISDTGEVVSYGPTVLGALISVKDWSQIKDE